ncbi:hypothetical protein FOH24_13800 [Acetobacter tropicalis]|uniref:Uncharacterized protein n=1 Tax=Acetobacter tropicalis TaxID=104102 RepID=A0A094YI20_9PROT|nr:hypothetical protein [Acetobacter tropicalis]KAA8387343.1 hypothetical protein FOH24_13800 [Acetobacter tropicalis]KAA8387544.1 hypothetical protein FOH22_09495 [Acetobacter tropicalis]KGB20987.1 hypothetical protein AtDm6_3352 [Acetobacter tropicalis]MBC9010118.1 hypothetical protein [Acetobacter tropicalis]MDO8170947.1 hypothetical protein [Acetobacter tropicalis]
MENTYQFEQYRAALEQHVHRTVTDPDIRQVMLAHIAQMGAAMHAESVNTDAALCLHHVRRRSPLSRFVLGVVEGVA